MVQPQDSILEARSRKYSEESALLERPGRSREIALKLAKDHMDFDRMEH